VGAKPAVSASELEFIVNRILSADSDNQVVDAMSRHSPSGEARSTRTISSIRRTVEVTHRLLADRVKREVILHNDALLSGHIRDHWEKLTRVAEDMRVQLSVPDLRFISSEDIRRERLVIHTADYTGWNCVWETGKAPPAITLVIEERESALTRAFVEHAGAEKPGFDLEDWRNCVSAFMGTWRKLVVEIDVACARFLKRRVYVPGELEPAPYLPAYLTAWFIVSRGQTDGTLATTAGPLPPHPGLPPRVDLHPTDDRGAWLVRGKADRVSSFARFLQRLGTRHLSSKNPLQELANLQATAMEKTITLQGVLGEIAARGTFTSGATCSICRPWFRAG
jgi:hypothetical protein